MSKKGFRAGVISDTHGLIRPEALAILHGVNHILHAGDIGSSDVLTSLADIAPTTAIRGNIDNSEWAQQLPLRVVVELEGLLVYVVHNIQELDLDPHAAGFAAVVAGHTHRPHSESRSGVLYFNPGSAGPRRFQLPVAVGILHINNGTISGDIIEIPV